MFFDTNVLVYMGLSDETKAENSRQLLAEGGVVSVQVLNEYVSATRGKNRVPWPLVMIGLEGIRAGCRVVPLTLATHELGLAYAEQYQFAIYDSMIVAAAVLAGCATLYSEDMHDGLVIDGLTIRNPYALT